MQRTCQFVLAPKISKANLLHIFVSHRTDHSNFLFLRMTGFSTQLVWILMGLGLSSNITIIDNLFFSLPFRRVTLVICDSCGARLGSFIRDEDIICIYYRGADLRFVIQRLATLVRTYLPVTCLVMAGVNDMTFRAKGSRVVFPRCSDAFDLANHVINQILSVRRDILACYPWLRVAFAGVNGICLDKYNCFKSYPCDQRAIDDAIQQINSYIRLLNQNSRLYHPRITSKVHAWRRGRRVTRYKYLFDGLHPGPILLRQWARSIVKFHRINTLGLCYSSVLVSPFTSILRKNPFYS